MAGHIEIDYTKLMQQSHSTAHVAAMNAVHHLRKCIDDFDTLPPEARATLIAAYMQHAAIDLAGAIIAQQVRAGLDAISEAIDNHSPSSE